MDSRRISAALGFALLIGCVIGIVILIHNSGSTRRSSSSQHHGHFTSWDGKDGFANDPNYHRSQPTMQEVNELADELHRFLKPNKHIVKAVQASASPKLTSSTTTGGVTRQMRNGTVGAASQSATSLTKKGSVSAINYSIVSPSNTRNKLGGNAAGVGGGSSNFSSLSDSSTVLIGSKEEQEEEYKREGISHREPYPGHQTSPGAITEGAVVPSGGSRRGVVQLGSQLLPGGKERGGLDQDDLYTTSWLPSMIPPGPGLRQPPPNTRAQNQMSKHHYQHHHQQQQHYTRINEDGDEERTLSASQVGGSSGAVNKDKKVEGKHPPEYDLEEYSLEEDTVPRNDVGDNRDNNAVDHHHHHQPGHNDQEEEEDEEEDDEEEEEDDDDDDDNAEPKNLTAELETLFDLANHLYKSGTKGAAFQGFLKVINETVERSNNSRLLIELNEMYRRSGDSVGPTDKTNNKGNATTTTTSSISSSAKTRQEKTPYENSLTAFVFMSFGVFLLNQIHSFVQKSVISPDLSSFNNSLTSSSRQFPVEPVGLEWWYASHSPMLVTTEASTLDILFQPPTTVLTKPQNESLFMPDTTVNGTSITTPINSSTSETTTRSSSSSASVVPLPLLPSNTTGIASSWNVTTSDGDDPSTSRSSDQDNSFSSAHVNNMFRALLNVVNAYTSRDSQALECIWSLYCQDLDKTAEKQGLYGVAARINSVGLRLIMNQIPPSLTLDVILRSLVGWDGLPCRKMFPDCAVQNGTILTVDQEATTNSI